MFCIDDNIDNIVDITVVLVCVQRLMDLSMVALHKHRMIPRDTSQLPDFVQRMLRM